MDKTKVQTTDFNNRLNSVLRHIKKVEDNCNLLARKLPEELALRLVYLGRIHDASKLEFFEFTHLHKGAPLFDVALNQHRKKNAHHPEYWPSIHHMPDEYLAEMVCDCVARAQEFGTDAKVWFEQEATVKYNFSMDDDCGKKITYYLNSLLSPPFK